MVLSIGFICYDYVGMIKLIQFGYALKSGLPLIRGAF